MKRKNIYILAILLLCIAVPIITLAQVVEPPPPDDSPIDGGLSLLLAAGAAYGVKKYRDSRKKEQEGGDLK